MIDIGNSILFFSMLMSGVTGMKADYSKDYITSLDYHSSIPVAASTSEELKLIVYDVKNKSTNLIVTIIHLIHLLKLVLKSQVILQIIIILLI